MSSEVSVPLASRAGGYARMLVESCGLSSLAMQQDCRRGKGWILSVKGETAGDKNGLRAALYGLPEILEDLDFTHVTLPRTQDPLRCG
jgi:hypothetical protein